MHQDIEAFASQLRTVAFARLRNDADTSIWLVLESKLKPRSYPSTSPILGAVMYLAMSSAHCSGLKANHDCLQARLDQQDAMLDC